MSTQKIIPFNRSRTISVSDLAFDSVATMTHRLPNPKAFFKSLMLNGDEGIADPFSQGSANVAALCDKLSNDPKFQVALNNKTAHKIPRLVHALNSSLVVSAKSGHVACLSHTHNSLVEQDLRRLPTASSMLSEELEFDLISILAKRNFVYGRDELKLIYVSLIRTFGHNSFLVEFDVKPNSDEVSSECSEHCKSVPPYILPYPYSSFHHTARLGIGILVPAVSERPDDFESLLTFSPLQFHPIANKIIALTDYESSGVVYALRAERRLNRLKNMAKENPDFDHSLFLQGITEILEDVREACFRYYNNSVALPALVKTVAFVTDLVDEGKLNTTILVALSINLGIWEDITARFGSVPGEITALRNSIKEQGLRKKLLLGQTDIPNIEAAFILGLCLEDDSKDEKSGINSNA